MKAESFPHSRSKLDLHRRRDISQNKKIKLLFPLPPLKSHRDVTLGSCRRTELELQGVLRFGTSTDVEAMQKTQQSGPDLHQREPLSNAEPRSRSERNPGHWMALGIEAVRVEDLRIGRAPQVGVEMQGVHVRSDGGAFGDHVTAQADSLRASPVHHRVADGVEAEGLVDHLVHVRQLRKMLVLGLRTLFAKIFVHVINLALKRKNEETR